MLVTHARGVVADDAAPVADARTRAQLRDPFDHVRGEIAGAGLVSVPYGDGGGTALGFAISFAAGWGPIPLLIGVDFTSGWGASARSNITVSGAGQQFVVDRVRQDNTMSFDAWARLQPAYFPVRPYIEGIIGTKHVRTEDSLLFAGSRTRTSLTTEGDWTSSLGWGAGLDFAGLLRIGPGVSFGFGFRHLSGGMASFTRAVAPNATATEVSYRASTNANVYMLTLVGLLDIAGAGPGSEAR